MKEFLQTIFKSTEDRFKNPFIGTFITSWIVFNWKPILYLLFSEENIRDRITYISSCYNDIWCYLWLPLISAILYNSALPYLNLLFEYLVSFSIKRRNNVSLKSREASLELQIQVERHAITLEEEKTTFRERNSHNQMVESLQSKINYLNDQLEEANKQNSLIQNIAIQDKEDFNRTINKINQQAREESNSLGEIISDEKAKNKELQKEITADKTLLTKYEFNIHDLTNELQFQKFKFERFKNPVNKIITVNNLVLLEYFLSDNVIYYEVNEKIMYDSAYVATLASTSKISDNNNDRTTIAAFESQLLSMYPDPSKMINNFKM